MRDLNSPYEKERSSRAIQAFLVDQLDNEADFMVWAQVAGKTAAEASEILGTPVTD